jgi:hypothetical protein
MDDLIQQGVDALKAGKRETARKLLVFGLVFFEIVLFGCSSQKEILDPNQPFTSGNGNKFQIVRASTYTHQLKSGESAYSRQYTIVVLDWECIRSQCMAGGFTLNGRENLLPTMEVPPDIPLPADASYCCGFLNQSSGKFRVYLVFRGGCDGPNRLVLKYTTYSDKIPSVYMRLPDSVQCK